MPFTASNFTKVTDYTVANKRYRVRDVQLPASYTTGGDTITAAQVGLHSRITTCEAEGNAMTTDGATGRTIGFLHQSDGSVKVVVQTTASAQAASTSDQSAYFVRVTFTGH